jgi:hypothetical protein
VEIDVVMDWNLNPNREVLLKIEGKEFNIQSNPIALKSRSIPGDSNNSKSIMFIR